ncbi:MAG: M2 family metallopeptidase, partial [Porphyrobacter sp.]|nr:M2 family metallopeptidase [Porphyrobacter sp.]
MKLAAPFLRSAAAALAIAVAAPLAAQDAAPAAESAATYPETPEGAKAWLAAVEADLAAFSVEFGHVSWINATYINHDSDTLAARYGAELTLKQVGYANDAARYARVAGLDAETTRKLDMLRNSIGLPAPRRPGAAEELNAIATSLGSAYGRGKGTLNGKPINGSDIEAEMGNLERTPDELKEMWASWHDNVG